METRKHGAKAVLTGRRAKVESGAQWLEVKTGDPHTQMEPRNWLAQVKEVGEGAR